MLCKMSGQPDGVKPRKRKSNSEVKSSRKGSASRRRCVRGQRPHSAAESVSAGGAFSKEQLSRISCECTLTAGRRRCLASPELEGAEGKENELLMDCYRTNSTFDKQEAEDMECEDSGRSVFPDDDSNQILPVEQFFGNLDSVQDFPQRSSSSSARTHRENGRRHFYAPADSDEEELDFSREQDGDRGGVQ